MLDKLVLALSLRRFIRTVNIAGASVEPFNHPWPVGTGAFHYIGERYALNVSRYMDVDDSGNLSMAYYSRVGSWWHLFTIIGKI
jgi:hypothetical protein